jgi:hypothetical protein
LQSLKQFDKKLLLTASLTALKLAIHYITSRASAVMLCSYKLALTLYKTYKISLPEDEWIEMNFEQTLISRHFFHIIKKQTLDWNELSLNRFDYIKDPILKEGPNKT